MKERVAFELSFFVILQAAFLLFLCSAEQHEQLLPMISPDASPHPFLPFIAPSPLVPYVSSTAPKLSGLCLLNFTASDSLVQTTSYNCWTTFAPVLANVMCCPQLKATLTILLGLLSKETGFLSLNVTESKHCLSDLEQLLVGKGASNSLRQICSVHPSNFTAASCPVTRVDEFESTVDTSKLLVACEKVDPVKECCEQACQNAILEAATNIALKASEPLADNSVRINDCRNIVHRWLASKLDPSRAKETLRRLTNCNINNVCPLVFPHVRQIGRSCGDGISNQTGCCHAMDSYVAHLQKQTLITNLQALDCSTSLGLKLQKLNITKNIYSICHITLKDFSLQVGNQVSGCLLSSLPSDAIFDKTSGISFTCDLNDNIPAPWPSSSQSPGPSCNKTVKIPALPAAASAQASLYDEGVKRSTIIALSAVLTMLLL